MINHAESVHAENVNYWQTSRTSPDMWLEKAKREIARVKGSIVGEGFMSDGTRSSYLLVFQINSDQFKIAWPVLESKRGNARAARIQAATAPKTLQNRCMEVQRRRPALDAEAGVREERQRQARMGPVR